MTCLIQNTCLLKLTHSHIIFASYEIDCHIINLITRKNERKRCNKTFLKREKEEKDTNEKGSINVIVCESRLPLNCSFKTSVL